MAHGKRGASARSFETPRGASDAYGIPHPEETAQRCRRACSTAGTHGADRPKPIPSHASMRSTGRLHPGAHRQRRRRLAPANQVPIGPGARVENAGRGAFPGLRGNRRNRRPRAAPRRSSIPPNTMTCVRNCTGSASARSGSSNQTTRRARAAMRPFSAIASSSALVLGPQRPLRRRQYVEAWVKRRHERLHIAHP